MNDLILLKKDIDKTFKTNINRKSRKRDVVNGRIAFSYIARTHLKKSFRVAGEFIKKDHSSIIHYVKTFDDLYQYDKEFKDTFDKIEIESYYQGLNKKEEIEEEIKRLQYKVKELKKLLKNEIL